MRVQNNLCCLSEWSLLEIFWAIRGALPPLNFLAMINWGTFGL